MIMHEDIKIHHSVLLRTVGKIHIIITLKRVDGHALSNVEIEEIKSGVDLYAASKPKAYGDKVHVYEGKSAAYIVYEGIVSDTLKKDAPILVKHRADNFFGKDCSAKGIGKLILDPPRYPVHLNSEEKKAALREMTDLIRNKEAEAATSSEVLPQSGTPAPDSATHSGEDRSGCGSDWRGRSQRSPARHQGIR